LDFFPLDIDYFDDTKILKIENKFGLTGSVVATRLLCHIYRNGYYTKWDDDEAIIFARKVGNGITWGQCNEIVQALIEVELFSDSMFTSHGILTSKGIQERWLRIIIDCNRKARLKSDFNLLIQDQKSDLKAEKSEELPQSKVKEIKEKESKALSAEVLGDVKEHNQEQVRKSNELIETLCKSFEVRPITTSKIYSAVSEFVSTVSNRNELDIVAAALENYVAYKARSNQQKHGIEKWIGSKDKYYQDGIWKEIDWGLKLKNYANNSDKQHQGASTAASATIESGKSFGDIKRYREGGTNRT
jgi:hypothetical protein